MNFYSDKRLRGFTSHFGKAVFYLGYSIYYKKFLEELTKLSIVYCIKDSR